MRKRILTLALAAISLAVLGQTGEVGFFGGVSYYIGDLNPAKHFLSSKPAYGVVARVNLNPRWSFKLNGYRGRVAGDDYVSNANISRGLQFESEILDISAVAEFNFFEYFTGSKRDVFTPYILAASVIFILIPSRRVSGFGISARKDNRPDLKAVSPTACTVSVSLSELGLNTVSADGLGSRHSGECAKPLPITWMT
jgi:hypothetical protein